MASLDEVNGLTESVAQLTAFVLKDVQEILRFVQNVPEPERHDFTWAALMDVLLAPLTAVAELSGQFYVADREAAGYTTAPPSVPEYTVPEDRVHALTGWMLQPLKETDGATPDLPTALSRGKGAATRLGFDPQREIIYEMGAEDDHQVYYQRMAKPGCCAFCAMLASRGAVYTSEAAAGKVVGRGVPIPRKRRRGGQAGGTQTRGTRAIGEDYHDDCRCTAVAVHESRAQAMEDAAAQWADIYHTAREAAMGKLERNTTELLVPETHTVNGQPVTRYKRKMVHSWINDDPDSPGYGEETAGYGAVQSKILNEMRTLAKAQDLIMA